MPREQYQDDLAALRGEVSAMADLTLERYEQAIDVLESGDPVEARQVIEGDAQLNEWYLDIENRCIELIALQQPVASDLRFIASSFKVVTDLERIGDLATNLARYGREAGGELFPAVEVAPVALMAGEMVADAMDAYDRDDSETAREIADCDDDLDERCLAASETVVRELMSVHAADMESGEVEATLENASRTLLTVRDLERVGDHAVNICARTLYMVDNDDELVY